MKWKMFSKSKEPAKQNYNRSHSGRQTIAKAKAHQLGELQNGFSFQFKLTNVSFFNSVLSNCSSGERFIRIYWIYLAIPFTHYTGKAGG